MATESEPPASSLDHETWPPPPVSVAATDPYPDDLLIGNALGNPGILMLPREVLLSSRLSITRGMPQTDSALLIHDYKERHDLLLKRPPSKRVALVFVAGTVVILFAILGNVFYEIVAMVIRHSGSTPTIRRNADTAFKLSSRITPWTPLAPILWATWFAIYNRVRNRRRGNKD